MEHKEALNKILANTCVKVMDDQSRLSSLRHAQNKDDNEIILFALDLCCCLALVRAKRTGQEDDDNFSYEILSVDFI